MVWGLDTSIIATDLQEDFTYDNTLNRLISATLSGQGASQYQALGLNTISLSYDDLGNILNKSDVGGYLYSGNAAGPHAVTSVNGAK